MRDDVVSPRVTRVSDRLSSEKVSLALKKSERGLNALYWDRHDRVSPGPGEVEIAVSATALNFRDVMLAQGVLPADAFEGGFAGSCVGMECSGIVSRAGAGTSLKPGDRVVAISKNAFSSHVNVPETLCVLLPETIDLAVASSLPVVFLTAEYALRELVDLKVGESVLIHGGAGGVGLACMQIARKIGARIFATAGKPDKRDLLYALGAEAVFDSRCLEFDHQLRAANDGLGANVVVNSLSGEAMERSIACLEPFGHFIELGKRDIVANSTIGLRAMRNNISYHAVDVDQLLTHRPDTAARMMQRIATSIRSGELSPLPVEVFQAADISSAFRHVQRSNHIGKTVVEAPELSPPDAAPSIRGVWLVTGGLSGFGFETACWLAERGADTLWLVSRTGQLTDDQISRLAESGAVVHQRSVDITDANEVRRLFDEIDRERGELNGVVHGAMVMNDAYLADVDPENIRRVMAPKADGARLLDENTRKRTLDHFWLYSSVAARIGNPGQAAYVAANRAMEGIAARRREDGLPALAIAWGPIGDVGYLSEEAELANTLEMKLGRLMGAREALDALWSTLSGGFEGENLSIGHMPWSALKSEVAVISEPLFEYLDISDMKSVAGKIVVKDLVTELGPRKARDRILSLVQEQVASILHIAPSEVDVLRPLTEMGFDSLMMMNLKMVIEEQLDFDVGVLAVGSDVSLGRMVNMLLDDNSNADDGPKTIDLLAESHLTDVEVTVEDRQRILDIVSDSRSRHG